MDKKLNSSELLAEIMNASQVKTPELKAKQLRLLQKLGLDTSVAIPATGRKRSPREAG